MDCRVECSFWKLNKFLLSCYGLWPYQSNWSKYCCYLIFIFSMLLSFLPLIIGFTEEKDPDIVIFFESIVAFVIIIGGVAICTGSHIHMNRIKNLYDQITMDWETMTEPDEIAILKNYALRGKRLSIIFIGTFSGSYTWFFSLTYVPLLINKGVTKSYLRSVPLYSNSWIISDKFHNLQVFWHECLFGLFYAMFVFIASTSMYISSVSHICGMFEIVCHRLRKLTDIQIHVKGKKAKIEDKDEKIIKKLRDIVAQHKEAIKGVHIVSMLFGPTFFIVESCVLMSLAMLIFDFNYNMDRSILLPARIFFIGLIFAEYIFYVNYGGQQIIEYSNKVLVSTYFMKWYLLSNDARKMLLMILQRSSRGNSLSAGIMRLSLENFTQIIKLSWSFACVLLSSQKKYYKVNVPE